MVEALQLIAGGLVAISLLPAYLIALVAGGAFLVLAVLMGGHADGASSVGTDLSADLSGHFAGNASGGTHAGSGMHHGAGLTQWFSMQFLIYFAALFGAIGTVLTYMTALSSGRVAALAVAGGVIGGQAAHQTLRALRRSSGNSALEAGDYLNRSARVTVAVSRGAQGEVAVTAGGTERFLPAVARHAGESFEKGAQVFVVGYHEGRAELVSRQEYEFTTDSTAV